MFKKLSGGRRMLALAVMAALGACAAPMAQAAVVNGGFEDFPDFNGYSTTGNTTIQLSDFHPTIEGLQQALISNGAGTATSGNDPVTTAQVESFLNLSAGALSPYNAVNGSAIKQTFSANAGAVLTFHYDFLTNEAINGKGISDAAFVVTLQSGGGPVTLNVLANTVGSFVATDPLSGAGSYAPFETGYQTFTTTLATAGTYTLGLAVTNAFDANFASGLLVDAIDLTAGRGGSGGGGAAVPLPLALLVMPLGAAVAGCAQKRLRNAR